MASPSTILVGSASWTDRSLIACGRFYPRAAMTAEERLRFYATQFPLVEVDSSYYGMPAAANAHLWAQRAPADFVFNVKAFRAFTGHQVPMASLHADLQGALGEDAPAMLYWRDLPQEIQTELWRRFSEALEPLRMAGKLGAVHFQFAPWITGSEEGRAHVRRCAEHMEGFPLAVEFRHASWFEGAQAANTLAFERDLGVAHTVVDAPQGFRNTVPAVWQATNPSLAVVRLHGRNAATWNYRGPGSTGGRFHYVYGEDELAPLVPRLRELSRQAAKVHVVFNTNHEDQGQANARKLMKLLASA